jgi:hypothetical protein
MRQLVSILLSTLFLYYSAGYYVTFKAEQYLIKKAIKLRIKNQVPENELTHLVFSPSSEACSEIEWIEDHEFRYNGQMFDIVRQVTDDDGTIHYYCINDRQEEMLFADLKNQLKNLLDTKNADNRQNQPVNKYFDKDYIVGKFYQFLFNSDVSVAYHPTDIFLAKAEKEVPTPPPKRV